jgi:Fe-S cluster assembly protein SufD
MKNIEIDLKIPNQVIEITQDTIIAARFKGVNIDELKCKVVFLHKIPNVYSRIEIKAVLTDKAKFDFEGVLKIEKGAKNVDTYLKIDCLVIGENASARAIPSLEINESEVKGGHGATIGYIDPSQLHYIQSRGLDKNMAEAVITESFLK